MGNASEQNGQESLVYSQEYGPFEISFLLDSFD